MRRAAFLEHIQLGAESTAGTEVAAGKQLGLLNGYSNPNTNVEILTAAGGKYPVAAVSGKEHAVLPFSGRLSFNDLPYILAMHLENPAASSGTFTYVVEQWANDVIKTFSVQNGSAARAEKFAYGFVPDFRLACSMREITLSGTILGKKISEGATLTSSPTRLAVEPPSVKDWSVLIGTAMDASNLVAFGTSDGLKTAEFTSAGKWEPDFSADGTDSFSEPIEGEVDCSLAFTAEHNSALSAYLAGLRSGTQYLFRLLMTGRVIGAGPGTYSAKFTFPAFFENTETGVTDRLKTRTHRVRPSYNSTYLTTGGVLEVVVVTELSAL